MRLGAWTFSPRPIPTLATAAVVALTLWLAHWQDGRATEKAGRQALLEERTRQPVVDLARQSATAEALAYRRVRAAGSYLPGGQVFVDNRQHAGRAGFHVYAPLGLEEGGATVLVNRGWIARDRAYPRAPAVALPGGRVVVEGLATNPPARYLELSAANVAGDVWQNLSTALYRERRGIDVLPIVIFASRPDAGLVAVEDHPDAGVMKHREYALTWLALAVTAASLWLALNLRKA